MLKYNLSGAMDMRKGSHVQYDIEYHIVWTTKYRYKVLVGKIAERARELIRQSCNSMEVTIMSTKYSYIKISSTIKRKNIKSIINGI